jgi:flagellar motor protein MotB
LLFSFSEIDAQKWQQLVRAFGGQLITEENSSTDSIFEDNLSVVDENNIQNDESILDLERLDENETGEEYEDSDVPMEEEKEEILVPVEEENPDEDEINDDFNEYDEKYINEQFESLYQELLKFNDLEGLNLEISRNESEIKIRLSNNLLFAPERANINAGSIAALKEITKLVKSYDDTLDQIVMEGNTDNLPIKSGLYRDNFELSIERALNVLYFFKYEGGFEPNKLVPMGYGEFNPVAENDTEEGRAKNRRTDILLIKTTP